MMDVRKSNNGDEAYRFVVKAGWERLARAVLEFWNGVQAVLNQRINPPPYLNSAPKGQPPAKRTGFGAANVIYELDQAHMEGRVGLLPNAKYMAFHERGAHPWLMATLKKMMPRLKQIIEGGKAS